MRVPRTRTKANNAKSGGILVLFLIIGAMFGGILGEFAANSNNAPDALVPYLIKTFPIFDMTPVSIDLYVMKLIVGVSFYPNLASILGMVVAIFFWYRFSR